MALPKDAKKCNGNVRRTRAPERSQLVTSLNSMTAVGLHPSTQLPVWYPIPAVELSGPVFDAIIYLS